MMKSVLILCLATIFPANSLANIIINGDFENNTATQSVFNLTNSKFNSTVDNVTAFGSSNEIDLITGLDYGIMPQSGNWKLSLHQYAYGVIPVFVDAFSFDLSSPIICGNEYTLQFYAAGSGGNAPIGPVEIGLSNNAQGFGTQIFSGIPSSKTTWTLFNHIFIAPVDATYLTVRNALVFDMAVNVDNFSLIPEPATLSLLALGAILAGRKRRTV